MKIPKNLRIDATLNERLKRHAKRYKLSETSIIEEAIENYIDLKEVEKTLNWWGLKTDEQICGVYKITNTINGKVYIGKSINIKERVMNHFSTTREHTPHFRKDLEMYKQSDFDVEILEVCKAEEVALVKEEYYIRKYKSYDPEFGYNGFKNRYLN